MEKIPLYLFGIVCLCVLIFFVKPILSVTALAALNIGLFMWFYRSGAYIFAKPLPRDNSLCLYITKQKEVLVDQMERTGEGFLKFKNHFGVLEVTEDSSYHMFGKPVNIAVEGVSHTVLPKYAKLTQDLARMGFEDYRDAEKALGGAKDEEEVV